MRISVPRLRSLRSLRAQVRYRIDMTKWHARMRWSSFRYNATDRIVELCALPLGHWVGRRGGASTAAYALLHLNRAARRMGKGNPTKQRIYARKNLMVRHFCEAGYCVRASKQAQKLECWECGGSGDAGEGFCYKCDGSGVYAEITLIKFSFRIGDRFYSWHQPERLVAWPVQLKDKPVGEFKEDHPGKRVFSSRIAITFFMAVLGEYMRSRGIFLSVVHQVPNLARELNP